MVFSNISKHLKTLNLNQHLETISIIGYWKIVHIFHIFFQNYIILPCSISGPIFFIRHKTWIRQSSDEQIEENLEREEALKKEEPAVKILKLKMEEKKSKKEIKKDELRIDLEAGGVSDSLIASECPKKASAKVLEVEVDV